MCNVGVLGNTINELIFLPFCMLCHSFIGSIMLCWTGCLNAIIRSFASMHKTPFHKDAAWSSVSDSIVHSSTWATLRVSKCIELCFLSAVKTLTSSYFRLCHLSITIVRLPHSYWTHRGQEGVCGAGGRSCRKVIYVNEYFLFNWTPPSLLITFPV